MEKNSLKNELEKYSISIPEETYDYINNQIEELSNKYPIKVEKKYIKLLSGHIYTNPLRYIFILPNEIFPACIINIRDKTFTIPLHILENYRGVILSKFEIIENPNTPEYMACYKRYKEDSDDRIDETEILPEL